mmetsp:Transcript_8404/g.21547  ORF Transcript_8404/g.21547 Transcript_8404/m.21547 type:complete len:201 (+) Transcript_8404:1574-2176(+)
MDRLVIWPCKARGADVDVDVAVAGGEAGVEVRHPQARLSLSLPAAGCRRSLKMARLVMRLRKANRADVAAAVGEAEVKVRHPRARLGKKALRCRLRRMMDRCMMRLPKSKRVAAVVGEQEAEARAKVRHPRADLSRTLPTAICTWQQVTEKAAMRSLKARVVAVRGGVDQAEAGERSPLAASSLAPQRNGCRCRQMTRRA